MEGEGGAGSGATTVAAPQGPALKELLADGEGVAGALTLPTQGGSPAVSVALTPM